MSSAQQSTHPPVRRVVTGHTPSGKAVVLADAPVASYPFGRSAWIFADIFQTNTSPPDNSAGIEFQDVAGDPAAPRTHVSSDGTIFRVADVPPGGGSPPHRTLSLDYGVLTHGTLTLLLDSSERVVLKPGDALVQRGTIHGWINEGAEWARIYVVVIPSQKVKIGEKELEAVSHT
ncbi:hypothetical protein M0805_004770 [Coniferiporia weirii]|nr:hypothetical protein M0805_004770 [Coniferiporia weirii]